MNRNNLSHKNMIFYFSEIRNVWFERCYFGFAFHFDLFRRCCSKVFESSEKDLQTDKGVYVYWFEWNCQSLAMQPLWLFNAYESENFQQTRNNQKSQVWIIIVLIFKLMVILSDCFTTCDHCQKRFETVSDYNQHLKDCYDTNKVQIKQLSQIEQINSGRFYIWLSFCPFILIQLL